MRGAADCKLPNYRMCSRGQRHCRGDTRSRFHQGSNWTERSNRTAEPCIACDTRISGSDYLPDDDVELDEYYVEQILRTYREHPEVAMVNGANLAHGIYPAGSLDRETAKKLIAKQRKENRPVDDIIPMTTAYGCRMSIRGSLLGKVSFDERLVLYGYLEDLDLAFACRKYGSIVENPRALGVHIEVAFGRMGEKRRGYSEVVNPFYIWSKRTGARLPRVFLGPLARSVRNAVRAIKGEGHERLIGNLLGWANVATFRPCPEKILEM